MNDKQQELLNDVTGGESNCCGAKMYNDICSDCKEHCEAVCEHCGDTGIVEISGDDGSGNWDKVGEKICVCKED